MATADQESLLKAQEIFSEVATIMATADQASLLKVLVISFKAVVVEAFALQEPLPEALVIFFEATVVATQVMVFSVTMATPDLVMPIFFLVMVFFTQEVATILESLTLGFFFLAMAILPKPESFSLAMITLPTMVAIPSLETFVFIEVAKLSSLIIEELGTTVVES